MTIRIILISIMMCIYYNLIIIYILYIIIRLIPKCFGISYCHIVILSLLSLLSYCIYMIVFQHLNYVFHYDFHIFSMQRLYIVLYCIQNLAFTLIFNILYIEVYYDCHVFTVQRVYNGQNFYTYHTVSYRIHP